MILPQGEPVRVDHPDSQASGTPGASGMGANGRLTPSSLPLDDRPVGSAFAVKGSREALIYMIRNTQQQLVALSG